MKKAEKASAGVVKYLVMKCLRAAEKDIQPLTDKYIKLVDAAVAEKEKEVMTV